MCSAGGGSNTGGEEANTRAGGNEEEAGAEEEGRGEMREVERVGGREEDEGRRDRCVRDGSGEGSRRHEERCCREKETNYEERKEGQGLGPEDYPRLARDGIQLMLNNRFTEAEELFRTHTNDSIHMAMGYCYLTFMNAVMSFEEEKVSHSMDTLRNMERRCGGGGNGGEGGNGWLSSVKNIVMGSLSSSSSPVTQDQSEEPGSQLELQVALADCQVLLAILTFLQQELGSYVRGGWTLRKAWKVYEHAYTKVKRLYRQTFNGGDAFGQDRAASPSSEYSRSLHGSHDELKSPGSWSVGAQGVPGPATEPPTPTSTTRMPLSKSVPNLKGFLLNSNHKQPKKPLPPDLVARLMASVSFGYGLFQLCTSLLPPSLLRVVSVLGLQGDRLAGLSALMFARRSHDMRAPLATLTLLWYHTVVRPFFALDGSKVRAGVEAAHLLLQEAQSTYANSALFLFFRGRVHRLQGDVSGALGSYRGALQVSPQRELQLLALHEVAWCHLLQLNWTQAQAAFASLKKESRWSKSFYAYVSAVCLGACGRSEECVKGMREVPALVRRSSHALEAFLLRRALKFQRESEVRRSYCLLRAYELLYMWNALPSCAPHHRLTMLEECEGMGELGELDGLCHLIWGALLDTLAHPPSATACHLRRSVALGPACPDEPCIPAFALYELGVLLCAQEETVEEGRKCLEDVRDNYRGYDFENRLSVRVHAALRNLS